MALATRLDNLGTETAFAVSLAAAEWGAKGNRIFPFHLGDINLPTSQNIVDAMNKAIADGKTGYCPGAGIPQAIADCVRIVPFNDIDALKQVLAEYDGQIAGMIFEPILMGAGIIVPQPGYLAAVKKLVHQHGALLTFDEVKTGLVIHQGGATAMYGVTPDIICLAKALGGGLPCGAIGGTTEVMSAIANGSYSQVGTFNGNTLTMAATKAVLTEVLTDDAYAQANDVGEYILKHAVSTLQSHGQGAHGYQFGFKVSVVFCAEPAKNYRDFLEVSTGAMHLNYLKQFNF